jgi:hypothetical protein
MSRIQLSNARMIVARSPRLAILTVVAGLLPSALTAQAALGVPFIGATNLSYYSAELSRSGGSETTTLYGASFAHRFSEAANPMRGTMQLRFSAHPFDKVKAGVLDVAAMAGVERNVPTVPGLSVAASTGVDAMAWGNDIANTGRLHLTIPANAGVSYDLHVKSATVSPFAMGTIARYDLRSYVNDVRQTSDRGWDASYTTGASLRLKGVVLTTSRIVGEYGMPNKSRWAFSAGISF